MVIANNLIEICCWFIDCWLIYKQLTKFKIAYIDTISIYSHMNPGCPLYLKKSVTDWNSI